jgi:hypothetical protein
MEDRCEAELDDLLGDADECTAVSEHGQEGVDPTGGPEVASTQVNTAVATSPSAAESKEDMEKWLDDLLG